MLLWVTGALAWSHRGHVWNDDALPLGVCPEAALEEPTMRAMLAWNQGRGWLELDCESPDIEITMEWGNPGPLARFELQPEVWETGDCEYVAIADGLVSIGFSGDIDWGEQVGTAAGDCAGMELQTRILQRYLGLALGLDTSAAPSAMEAFGGCESRPATADDRAGLAALYAAPRVCDGITTSQPTVQSMEGSGCSTTPAWSPLWAPWMLVVAVRRRRGG